MLDLINLREKTALECHFEELPISIRDRGRKFFSDGEESLLTIVNKSSKDYFTILFLTSLRIVKLHFAIEKGVIQSDFSNTSKDISIIIPDLSGFKFLKIAREQSIHLEFVLRSGMEFDLGYLYSEELFDKLTKTILNLQRDWLLKTNI